MYVYDHGGAVGLDPQEDIEWVTRSWQRPLDQFADGKIDAFLASPPEPQELRARKIGRFILNTAMDKPWSHYFCCMFYGQPEFVRDHPVATKRFLRAVFKAADICAASRRCGAPAGRCRVHREL